MNPTPRFHPWSSMRPCRLIVNCSHVDKICLLLHSLSVRTRLMQRLLRHHPGHQAAGPLGMHHALLQRAVELVAVRGTEEGLVFRAVKAKRAVPATSLPSRLSIGNV